MLWWLWRICPWLRPNGVQDVKRHNCNPVDSIRVAAGELMDAVEACYVQQVEANRLDRADELRVLIQWVTLKLRESCDIQ